MVAILRNVRASNLHPSLGDPPADCNFFACWSPHAEQVLTVLDLRQVQECALARGGPSSRLRRRWIRKDCHTHREGPPSCTRSRQTGAPTLLQSSACAIFRATFCADTQRDLPNFHQWGSQRNGVRYREGEDEEAFGDGLLQRLQHGVGDAQKYDAVFIDEAQDFSKSWFLCSKLALKEPDDGDLLIVSDGSQLLYHRRPFTWREAGVYAVGRTINRRFDLDKLQKHPRVGILTIRLVFA